MGAAIATCLSYIAVFTFRTLDTRKYVKINYFNIKRLISMVILILITCFIYIDNIYFYIVLIGLFVILILLYFDFWKSIVISVKKNVKRRKKVYE